MRLPVAAIFKCLLFGFAIALLIVNYGVRRGFASAARSAFGAGLADLSYALIASIAGDLLVAFGVTMLIGAIRAKGAVRALESTGTRNEFATTCALTMLNPLTIIAFAGFAGQLPLAGSTGRAVMLALSVFLGSIVVQLFLALTGTQLDRRLSNPSMLRVLNAASGIGIIFFGTAGLWPQVYPS